MTLKITRLAAISALAATLAAGAALAQPTLSPQGGSAGPDMDHSRMGGSQGRPTPGPAPVLTNPSGGSGTADMDHSRMGGGGQGAGTPGGSTMGSPSGAGPEVRHGNQAAPDSQSRPAPRPRN